MMVKQAMMSLIAIAMSAAAVNMASGSDSFKWIQSDDEVSLLQGDRTIWHFRAGPEDQKPAFHPLALPDGRVLTGYRPDDHAWHRANWFSWKFLNDKNFWEEDENGQGRDGLTEVTHWSFHPGDDYSAELKVHLRYETKEGDVLLTEIRKISISAPDADGYEITTTAQFDVIEDTTINAWFYGGYAVRLSPDLAGWKFIDNKGTVWDAERGTMVRENKQTKLIAPPTPWMAFVEKPKGPTSGIAILDHPSNPRYPVRWLALPHMPYFNPVFFADEDLVLKKGDSLELRYRLVVFEKQEAVPFLRNAQQKFSTE